MDLDRLMKPRHVAVIGVSIHNDNHPANVIFKKLQLRYPVEVYAVNNRGGEIHGFPVYAGLAAVPEPIDLAIIAVRAQYALSVVQTCIDQRVGGAIIVSGGFAETGNSDLQDQVSAVAKPPIFPSSDRIAWAFSRPAGSIRSFCPVSAWRSRNRAGWPSLARVARFWSTFWSSSPTMASA
ncbi:CoA-binding protein [Desulfosarcina cetonica]|uniref:CoA-binding protein n=1 Tax=Desulfosarcina cetonica TaxID=90730 RepID=UPI0012EEDA25|nr:CoA-binding protein [Desulfosarcina cetonica]